MRTGARSMRIGHITMRRSVMTSTPRPTGLAGKAAADMSVSSMKKLKAIWGGIGIDLRANRGWSGSGRDWRRRMRGIGWKISDQERIDRSQKPEVRGQKSEVRSQRSEIRSQR